MDICQVILTSYSHAPHPPQEHHPLLSSLSSLLPSTPGDPALLARLGPWLERLLGDERWWPAATSLLRCPALADSSYPAIYKAASSSVAATDGGRGRHLLVLLLARRLLTRVAGHAATLDNPPGLLAHPATGLACLDALRRVEEVGWRVEEVGEWLDYGWEVAEVRRWELVPAKDLGVYVTLVAGRSVLCRPAPKEPHRREN